MRMAIPVLMLAVVLDVHASEELARNSDGTLGAPGDPIDARFAPFLQDGCFDGPPIPTTEHDEGRRLDPLPGLDDMPMSSDSIRFIITPDNYRGDGLLMVQIDSGMRRSMGAEGRPFIIASVGNSSRTCTVRMALEACPEAARVNDELRRMRIPIGYGMGTLERISLHATTYSMQFHGNGLNRLSYFQPGNPLEKPLMEAKAALKPCLQPAFDALAKP